MMRKIVPCSVCEDDREMKLFHSHEAMNFKGKDITFEAEYYRCTICGTEIEEPGQLDRNLDAAREVYDRLHATPSPAELVSLRERYGASQKAFGMLLGFGEATMNTYEQGNIPDPVNRLLLKLARNPLVFKEIYATNKHRIGLTQRRRIESSPGYLGACCWDGMEGLHNALGEEERSLLGFTAQIHGLSIQEQVKVYASTGSRRDSMALYSPTEWDTPRPLFIALKDEKPHKAGVA